MRAMGAFVPILQALQMWRKHESNGGHLFPYSKQHRGGGSMRAMGAFVPILQALQMWRKHESNGGICPHTPSTPDVEEA